MSDRIVERYLYDRVLADNAALKAEISRLSNFETALNRILDFAEPNSMHNHNQKCVQSAIDWMAGIRESEDDLTAELEKVRAERDFYHQQVITLVDDFNNGKTLKWAEKAIEEIEQDAFDCGQDAPAFCPLCKNTGIVFDNAQVARECDCEWGQMPEEDYYLAKSDYQRQLERTEHAAQD